MEVLLIQIDQALILILAFLISVFWEGFLVAQFLIDRKKTDLVSLQKKKRKTDEENKEEDQEERELLI